MKVEELFCPICKLATMQIHPSRSLLKDTPFNGLLKCNYCGFVKCKTAQQEDAEKMPKKSGKTGKNYF